MVRIQSPRPFPQILALFADEGYLWVGARASTERFGSSILPVRHFRMSPAKRTVNRPNSLVLTRAADPRHGRRDRRQQDHREQVLPAALQVAIPHLPFPKVPADLAVQIVDICGMHSMADRRHARFEPGHFSVDLRCRLLLIIARCRYDLSHHLGWPPQTLVIRDDLKRVSEHVRSTIAWLY